MKVLSIDASTKSSGWAVFDDTMLLDHGCITASSTDLIKRIHKMTQGLEEIIKKYNIETIVLEEVLPDMWGNKKTNLTTYKALMYLQAEINVMIHDNGYKVSIEYVYPNEWRAKCGIKTGSGIKREALKAADIKFIYETYGCVVNDDEADGIGIGHAYVHQLENEINW